MSTETDRKMIADWQSKELCRLARHLGLPPVFAFSEVVTAAIKRIHPIKSLSAGPTDPSAPPGVAEDSNART